MFETEDGIWDADGATAEEKENFFKMYPNAKRVGGEDGGGTPTADDYSFSETYSEFLPEQEEFPEGVPSPEDDALLKNIREPKNLQLELEAPKDINEKSFLNDYLEEEDYQKQIDAILYQGGDIATQTLTQRDQVTKLAADQEAAKQADLTPKIPTKDPTDFFRENRLDVAANAAFVDPAQDKTDFTNEYYKDLDKAGIVKEDFEGMLNNREYSAFFKEQDVKGTFKTLNPNVDQNELPVIKQRLLAGYLDEYVQSVTKRYNAGLAYKDYTENPSKYKGIDDMDIVYDMYTEENGITPAVDPRKYLSYYEKAFPQLVEKDKRDEQDYQDYIKNENKKGNARLTLESAVKAPYYLAKGFTEGVVGFLDFFDEYPARTLGLSTARFDAINLAKRERAMSEPENKRYLSLSGNSVEYKGKKYLKDSEGVIYDTRIGLPINNAVDKKTLSNINNLIDIKGVYDVDYSPQGFTTMGAQTLGDIIFQVAGTKGLGKARVLASSKHLAKANGFKSAAQFKNFQKMGYMPKAKGAGTFGQKIPIDARRVDAMIFTSVNGAQMGYQSTLREAKLANIQDDEAEKLANIASLQMGALYAGTGTWNPRIKALNNLDDYIAKRQLFKDAIKQYKNTGSKRAFGESIKSTVKSSMNEIKKFGSSGLQETTQELVQQGGETYVVNSSVNELAGKDFLISYMSNDDIRNTMLLSTAAGGLTSANLKSVKFKPNPHAELENLFKISKNIPYAKSVFNNFVERGTLTTDQANDIVNRAEAIGKYQAPAWMLNNPKSYVDAATKAYEIDKLVSEKESLGKEYHKSKDAEIEVAQEELQSIVDKAALVDVEEQVDIVEKITGKVESFDTSVELVDFMQKKAEKEGKSYDTESMVADFTSDGFFTSDDGTIYINKEVAVKTRAVSVASHELLHKILDSEFKNNKEMPRIVEEFKQVLKDKGIFNTIEQRMQKSYKDQGIDVDKLENADEYFTALSDLIGKGEVRKDQLEDSVWVELGRKIINVFKTRFGFKNAEFKTGQDVFDFVKNYQKNIKKGKLSKQAKTKLGEFKISDDKEQVEPETKRSLSLLDNINNLVPKDVKTKADFQGRKVFNPIFNATQPGGAIYNYVNSRAVSKEEANITLEGVVDRLINYDPAAVRKTKSGEPITFGEFLFANARFSKLDAKKRLAIESATRAESLDTEEARQVAEPVVEETTEAPRVEYKNLVESKVLPTEMAAKVKDKIILITKTLKSRIDAATSINKTVTPLMSEIKKEIGKQADIEFKKMLGAKRGGELETNYLKLKQPILENMTTTWLMQSMPFAIQKSVDGKFTSDWEGKKIDRESVGTDKAGRTAGAMLVKRLPNAASKITDKQFLTYMFKDGEVIRGRKEALAKAMAEEYAFDIYSQELRDPDSDIREAFESSQTRLGVELLDNYVQEFSKQMERGNIKRSISQKQEQILFSYFPEIKLRLEKANTGKISQPLLRNIMNDVLKDEPSISEEDVKKLSSLMVSTVNTYFNKESLGEADFARFVTETINKSKNKNLVDAVGITFDDISGSYAAMQDQPLVREKRRAIEQEYNIDLVERKGKEGIELIVRWMKGHNTTSSKIGDGRGQYYANVGDYYDNNLANIPGVSIVDGKVYYNGDLIKGSTLPPKAYKTVNKKKVPVGIDTFTEQFDQREKEANEAFDLLIDFLGFVRKNGSPVLWVSTMKSLDSNMQSMLKAAASVQYYFEGKYDGELVYEHMMPTNHVMLLLTQHFWDKKIDLEKLKELYSVAIVPKSMDRNINLQLQSTMQSDFDMLVDHITTRYYNDITIGMQDMYAMKKLGGKDAGTIFGEGWVKFNSNLKAGAMKAANKNKNLQKAESNASKRSYSENPKGISVYDFDDTLAFSKSQVIVNKDGKSYMITPAEFAAKGEQLLAEGAEFDFSEFNKVVKGTPGPLIPRLEKAIKKFGNENIFILTARPVASESAIHDFMKGLGLEIPRANITGLANSTAQAKADWMVGKVAEGYNDFYFTDDHYKNVKAVQDVLETFDVKSKVQQAVAKRKSSMSSDLNEMIERNKGVKAEATFSKVLARKKGASKGKAKFFVPYSAEDFRGLTSYTLAGKGKQGELDQAVFEKALILPYTRGVAKMEGAGQALKNDYRNLLKMFDLKKELGKKIADTGFTTDQAVRVYLWTQQGIEVPNISKRDQKQLNSVVSKNPDLVGFSEGLMAVSKKDNWVNPKEHWDVGSILKDLNEITEKINRKEYLAEFIENADEMFNPTNLNKLEAVYGTAYIEALQDSIRRMKSGSNRPAGVGKIEQKWLNWVNNSVGTIMFFNRRSALLQMLSFTNFINWSDNNPLRAAEAFANQPLYWKTWTKIFNSDKLKERRGGLKSDIQESEIANQARNSEDKAAAVLSYLLKVGFTPTQIADSFAIATGGATFLINRTRKYEKQGLSKKEAEAKAFEDFSLKSDETQQSGDPMLISQQQSSHLGRLVLAFQNTPMQYTRLIKKASKDLINGRGSTVENVSKIAYYGFVQNLIFSSLQSALFAMVPGFDDEEEEEGEFDKKAVRTVNSMIDTLLRGSGLAGAVVATIKNAIMKYQSEKEKGFTADHTYTVLELANVSPPIGSKLRKVYSAIQTEKYNKDVLDYMGMHVLLDGKLNPSPAYEIISNLASAGLNIPADRLLVEIKSINEALDSRNTAYQRAALALGWKTYDVNVKNEEQDLIKAYFKAERKEQGKAKAKQKREDKKKEEQDRIKAMSPQERGEYNNEKYRKKVAAARKAAETRRKNRANR